MKSISPSPIQKLQKAVPVSSLVWAAIVTAIVLAIAASASAQEDPAASEPVPETVRPLPKTVPLMPRATSTAPRMIQRPEERPMPTNATGTRPLNSADVAARREAVTNAISDRMSAFEERRTQLMEEAEARRSTIMEKRALIASSTLAKRAALREETQKRVIERASGLTSVAERAIANLEAMIVRLRAHADKFAAQSVDVSGTLATLDEAEKLLESAKVALEGIDTNVSYATMSETPKEDWTDAKEQFMSVRDILQEVRELLAEAVSSLRSSAPRPATESVTN